MRWPPRRASEVSWNHSPCKEQIHERKKDDIHAPSGRVAAVRALDGDTGGAPCVHRSVFHLADPVRPGRPPRVRPAATEGRTGLARQDEPRFVADGVKEALLMHVLGISCHYHDAAAALLRDGVLVAAAEEERFSRKKHDYGFPRHAIDFCLKRAGIRPEDLDYVVFYEKPLVKFERILTTALGTYPKSWRVFREAMISWFNEKLWIKGLILRSLRVPADRILFSDHHVSHAASAFFCSSFEEAAVLTVDGVGEWTTAGIGRARADWRGGGQSSLVVESEIRFPHSLGLLYSAFTAFLGFEVNEGAYNA